MILVMKGWIKVGKTLELTPGLFNGFFFDEFWPRNTGRHGRDSFSKPGLQIVGQASGKTFTMQVLFEIRKGIGAISVNQNLFPTGWKVEFHDVSSSNRGSVATCPAPFTKLPRNVL